MTKDSLKKHHFWLLAGLVPLFVLIAVILTWTGASSEISASSAKVKGEVDSIKGKQPKGAGYEKEMEKQKELLGKKVGELWEANWNDQRSLIVWPKDGERGRLANFLYDPKLKTKDGKPEFLKFGASLSDGPSGRDVFEVFTNDQIYSAPFKQAAELVEPTQFLGGWQSIFRYIRNWGIKTPDSDALWLTLEDLWVQRGLMLPIKETNDAAAAFVPVATKPGPDGKVPENKFTFRSRIWEVEFEIRTQAGSKALYARLTNVTDRLQLLGARNSMTLNVWFDTSASLEKGGAFPYQIQGEFVKAGETVTVTYLPTLHELFEGANATKVTKVEQVFDQRTVPVRRIDRLVIGYLDNRHQYAEMKTPTFIKAPEVTTDPYGGGGGFPGEGGPPAGGGPPIGRAGGLGPPSDGGPTGPGTTPGAGNPLGAAGFASTGWEAYREQYKTRYIDVTDQVRRIPVAMVLVVDQDYERDLLIAFSNSKLRFQVTQYHSKRFRGTIATGAGGDSYSPDGLGGSPDGGFGGFLGGGFGGDDAMGAGPGGRMGTPGRGAEKGGLSGYGGPPAGVTGPGVAGPGVTGPGAGGPVIPGGAFGGTGGFPTGGFGESTGIAETSSSSGLIEVSLYGVVTLYERFEEPKSDAAAAEPGASPAPAQPAPAPANPMNPPAPAAPMSPTGTIPPTDKPKQ